MDISYIINQLGEERSAYFNAVAPPIIQTSNFTFDSVADLRKAFEDEKAAHLYTRGNNPTVKILRQKIAALEEAEDAILVGSGAAAISNAVIAHVGMGDHVVCVENVYIWANKLLTVLLPRFGVTTTFVDGTIFANIKNAVQPNTKVIYLESPTSLVMTLQDLEAVAKFAKSKGIITILDNSHSTPLAPSPIKMGIDIVLHSATKYIGGHSDVVAGVIASSNVIIRKIWESELMTLGNILHPFDAWLLLRGLRTLPIRLKQASETTLKVLDFLQQHPKVAHIFHPFLPSHPQHELAKKQMAMPMSMFSVQFTTQDEEKVDAFCNALKCFLIAVSWGGHESLAIPVRVDYQGKAPYLVRFYIGLESSELLISDLEEGMKLL